MEAIKIKELIKPIRNKMPRYGTEKLHLDIADKLKENNIKNWQRQVFEVLQKPSPAGSKNKAMFHKSPNLIKTLIPTHSAQVFVNDITYIKLQDRYVYLALDDLYSKK